MITLDQLLASRDLRRERQLRWLSEYPELSLIVLTVNIPGNVKQTPESYDIGMEGVRLLREALQGRICRMTVNDFNTGFEAFLLADVSGEEAKSLAIGIEDTHPLGRLMDIDVIGHDGVPMSRSSMGHTGRRCLICGEDARICMRAGRHSVAELLDKIITLHHGYFQRT
ncbi:MAG: citrate lyase holo-[acyl-carrier protein] synthase [Muribaculaceae bacterium]|nr:citrate lyase holo-[acyl-carrier protein] synthase [Muribaculaceae bacterium]